MPLEGCGRRLKQLLAQLLSRISLHLEGNKTIYRFPFTFFIILGENVYVQVNLNSDDVHVKMRLHTCSAKPNINSDARLTYTLIKNG